MNDVEKVIKKIENTAPTLHLQAHFRCIIKRLDDFTEISTKIKSYAANKLKNTSKLSAKSNLMESNIAELDLCVSNVKNKMESGLRLIRIFFDEGSDITQIEDSIYKARHQLIDVAIDLQV